MARKSAIKKKIYHLPPVQKISKTKTDLATSNSWQRNLPMRKPIVTTKTAGGQRKSKDINMAPISPIEATVAPAYYNNSPMGYNGRRKKQKQVVEIAVLQVLFSFLTFQMKNQRRYTKMARENHHTSTPTLILN